MAEERTVTVDSERRFLIGSSPGILLLSGCSFVGTSDDRRTPHLMVTNRRENAVSVTVELTDGPTVILEDEFELAGSERETYYDAVDDNSTCVVDVQANDLQSSRKWSPGEGMLKAEIYDNELNFTISMA